MTESLDALRGAIRAATHAPEEDLLEAFVAAPALAGEQREAARAAAAVAAASILPAGGALRGIGASGGHK